ncbi:MAG: hypothetical protein JWM95_354 [Gemmatimonadetes bacterium]|nr:hypothetical protein [Gemmatimonadota bacterium]
MNSLRLLAVLLLVACSTNPPPDEDKYVIGTGASSATTVCLERKMVTVINRSNSAIDVSARFIADRRLIPLGIVGSDRSEEFEMPKGSSDVDYRVTNQERKFMPNGVELRFSCAAKEVTAP